MQHDMGQVSYRLKAYCDRPKFFMNHVDRRSVRITRMMLPSDLDMNQQVMIANEWANKVIYHISIPSKVYGADSDIPISFDLTPIADHLKVRSVSCSLKEYITCSTKSHHKTEGRIVNRLRDDHFSINPSTGRYTKTELLHVPSDSNHIIFDMSGDLIAVKHKIKFTVALQNKDGHISGKYI
jgi:hypothetical protein